MDKLMEKRYNQFVANKYATWKSRFTWRGLFNNESKHSTNIIKFGKETGAFEALKDIENVHSFYKVVDNLAQHYIKWVQSKPDSMYDFTEYKDMENFFKGSIGEFFFVELLDNVKCVFSETNSGRYKRNDFNFVAPRLKGEKDFGVDLTGVVNDKNCVIQVKFWNPYSTEVLCTDVVQKAHSDGIINGFINPTEKENIVICWLGNTDKVSVQLKSYEALYKNIVFIDIKSLDASINNKNKIFWNKLYEKMFELISN